MLNVTNATRIAELERALENVVEYLKKLRLRYRGCVKHTSSG